MSEWQLTEEQVVSLLHAIDPGDYELLNSINWNAKYFVSEVYWVFVNNTSHNRYRVTQYRRKHGIYIESMGQYIRHPIK